jgi:hypothetical protein
MSRTLDMIAEEEFELASLLEEMEGEITDDEAGAAVEAWLAALGAERDAKLTNYARYIRVLEARAGLKDEEIERLKKRGQQDRARAKWMQDKLHAYLRNRGDKKLNTGLYELARVKNGGTPSVLIDVPLPEVPDEYKRCSATVRYNRADMDPDLLGMLDNLLNTLRLADAQLEQQEEPDKKRIRQALQAGKKLPFAHLGDLGERLEIR